MWGYNPNIALVRFILNFKNIWKVIMGQSVQIYSGRDRENGEYQNKRRARR